MSDGIKNIFAMNHLLHLTHFLGLSLQFLPPVAHDRQRTTGSRDFAGVSMRLLSLEGRPFVKCPPVAWRLVVLEGAIGGRFQVHRPTVGNVPVRVVIEVTNYSLPIGYVNYELMLIGTRKGKNEGELGKVRTYVHTCTHTIFTHFNTPLLAFASVN